MTDNELLRAAARHAPLAHRLVAALCGCFGDPPQPSWAEASEADRDSTRAALHAAATHPGRTPADEHRRWADAKRAAGWRYGKVHDEAKRLHPLLVPYAKLPPEQKVKDVLFIELGTAIREGRLP